VRRMNLDLKRFIGDSDKNIVHDVDNEQGSECRIDGIVVAGNAITFAPDTFEQAMTKGYSACPYCHKV
jgi:hypothetical protein